MDALVRGGANLKPLSKQRCPDNDRLDPFNNRMLDAWIQYPCGAVQRRHPERPVKDDDRPAESVNVGRAMQEDGSPVEFEQAEREEEQEPPPGIGGIGHVWDQVTWLHEGLSGDTSDGIVQSPCPESSSRSGSDGQS